MMERLFVSTESTVPRMSYAWLPPPKTFPMPDDDPQAAASSRAKTAAATTFVLCIASVLRMVIWSRKHASGGVRAYPIWSAAAMPPLSFWGQERRHGRRTPNRLHLQPLEPHRMRPLVPLQNVAHRGLALARHDPLI